MRRPLPCRSLRILVALALAGACSGPLPFSDPVFRGETPREEYLHALERAGLAGTALARDWAAAGDSALADPVAVLPPHREEGLLEAASPAALGYSLSLRRGQRVRVEAGVVGGDSIRLFLELFRDDPDQGPVPVLAPDPWVDSMEYEPRRDETVVVRIQPELLRGGRYRVTLRVEGSLSFPVEGRDTRAILSFFGDDREAGRRVHHGVDIFAPRGTPVRAASPGVVTRVGTQNLGGKVVWVRDEELGISQYYAHLDTQAVQEGDRVEAGDLLGTVGNTGNARTTPPHLHFGLYRRGEGPLDPWYFLYRPSSRVSDPVVEEERLAGWARARNGGTRVRGAPDLGAEVVEEITAETPLRVMAGVGEWLRIRLPDGRNGYVLARLTEAARAPLPDHPPHPADR